MNKNNIMRDDYYANREWKGYTIDELEQRRAINAVKCDLIKEQLSISYKNMTASFVSSGTTEMTMNINRAMTYASYGIQIFRYARSFISLFKDFKSVFSNTQSK